ncbi:MAG: succinate dehydrogenase, cytochrome b556 subunit [Burkholderiales bacterium]|nr:succinate dehydrogenase, cytochrome b556 subunit [Burkholderiales bacterium]
MAQTPRPVFTNIHITQIVKYRMPLAAWVSILHRISGALMFLLLPLVIWLFDNSLSSETSYERFAAVFDTGIGIVPGILVKLVVFGLIWAYLHHFTAGLRHVRMDITHATSKEQGRHSAAFTLVFSLVLTVLLGAKLFGVF